MLRFTSNISSDTTPTTTSNTTPGKTMGINFVYMKKILVELVSDFDFQLGAIGVSMTVIFPMLDQLTHLLQFFGALGGLVLLFLSIRHKILEIEKLKKNKK